MQAHRSRVLESWDPTPTTCALRLARPEGFSFRAGQTALLMLPTPQGVERRPLTIASGPARPHLEFAVRRGPSAFKQALAALRPGDEAHLLGPKGPYVLDPARPLLMVAGGVGITPVKSILEHAADEGLVMPIEVLASHRTPEEIVYRRELAALEHALPHARITHHITRPDGTGWTGAAGRIGRPQLAAALQRLPGAAVHLSGAPAMVMELAGHVRALGVPREHVTAEAFWGYGGKPGPPPGRPPTVA